MPRWWYRYGGPPARHRRPYEAPAAGPFDPVFPDEIGMPAEFWRSEEILAASTAHLARITKSARNDDGKIRSGLHRVRPRMLDNPEDKKRWIEFMHLEIPFKEGYTKVLSGVNKGDYLFIDKADAALFKLWWG